MHRFIFPRLIVLVLSLLCSTLALANAGLMHFVRGEVSATDGQGGTRQLGKGDSFAAGDTIITGKGALAQLKFTDGALVSLQPNSSFRVDEYNYDGKTDGSEKGSFSLLQGGMRTITGAVGRQNRNNYKVNAVIATIGIRGTEYTAQLDDPKETLLVHTGEGLVEVCNSAGCIQLASGETGRVSSTREPKRTEYRPQLPPPGLGEETPETVFASGEQRSAQGGFANLSGLLAGPGYAVMRIINGDIAGGPDAEIAPNRLAVPDSGGNTTVFTSVGAPTEFGNSDGVLNWGRWANANEHTSSAPSPIENFHYVTGKPTTSTDMAALGNINASYQLQGGTTLTGSYGSTGTLSSGSLQISFLSGSINSTSLTLHGTLSSGATFSLAGTGTGPLTSPGFFSGSGTSPDLDYHGFVAGPTASHAGIVYFFEDSSNENFSGAAAFKRP